MGDVGLSKKLSYVLRHKAPELGYTILPGGYVPVSEILSNGMFKRYNLEDIRQVVVENQKKRFDLKDGGERGLIIAANQGHSFHVQSPELVPITSPEQFPVVVHGTYLKAWERIQVEVQSPELVPITSPEQFPVVVHGTYLKAWERIQVEGLRTMNRTHIHFARGEPQHSEVISGMRGSCQIMIFINLGKALSAGLQFFLSKNDVILSPGNEAGCIPPTYFLEVIQRHPRRRIDFTLPP